MDAIKNITKDQISEREAIIFLLVESGMSYRDLGERLKIDHTQVSRIYKKAKAKVDKRNNK